MRDERPSRESLQVAYIDGRKTMRQIAEELGVTAAAVYYWLKKYNIPTRSAGEYLKGRKQPPEICEIISRTHKGKKLSDETKRKMSEAKKLKGIGHKKKRPDGYIAVYYPDHPRSSKDGHIMEHILVMENVIGRHLLPNECVHHRNRKRDDNRYENLWLMTKSEHMSYHMTQRHIERRMEEKRNAQ